MSKKHAQNESHYTDNNIFSVLVNLQRPKAVSTQKSDRAKTAPIDNDFVIEFIKYFRTWK